METYHLLIIGITDIVLLTWLLYRFILIVEGTRAFQLLKGIVIIFMVKYASHFLGLNALHRVFANFDFVTFGFIAFLILFTPEIRQALAKLGARRGISYQNPTELHNDINEIVKACESMASKKIGALIVIQKKDNLRDYIDTGKWIYSRINSEIIETIFFPKNPLHDGAIIIKEGIILSAKCILPLSENPNIDKKSFGTRHRAAIGLSEERDAVVIAISEERGEISIAWQGELTRRLTKEKLLFLLREHLSAPKKEKITLRGLVLFNFAKKLLAFVIACLIWAIEPAEIKSRFDILLKIPSGFTVLNHEKLSSKELRIKAPSGVFLYYFLRELYTGSAAKPAVAIATGEEIQEGQRSFRPYFVNNSLIEVLDELALNIDSFTNVPLTQLNIVHCTGAPPSGYRLTDTVVKIKGEPNTTTIQIPSTIARNIKNLKFTTDSIVDLSVKDASFSNECRIIFPQNLKYWEPDKKLEISYIIKPDQPVIANPVTDEFENLKAEKSNLVERKVEIVKIGNELKKSFEKLKNEIDGYQLTLNDLKIAASEEKIKSEAVAIAEKDLEIAINEQQEKKKNYDTNLKNLAMNESNSDVIENKLKILIEEYQIASEKVEIARLHRENTVLDHDISRYKVSAFREKLKDVIAVVDTISQYERDIESEESKITSLKDEIDKAKKAYQPPKPLKITSSYEKMTDNDFLKQHSHFIGSAKNTAKNFATLLNQKKKLDSAFNILENTKKFLQITSQKIALEEKKKIERSEKEKFDLSMMKTQEKLYLKQIESQKLKYDLEKIQYDYSSAMFENSIVLLNKAYEYLGYYRTQKLNFSKYPELTNSIVDWLKPDPEIEQLLQSPDLVIPQPSDSAEVRIEGASDIIKIRKLIKDMSILKQEILKRIIDYTANISTDTKEVEITPSTSK